MDINQAKQIMDSKAAKLAEILETYKPKSHQGISANARLNKAKSCYDSLLASGANDIIGMMKKMIADGAIFYINHSGGKDSQAMYLYLVNVIGVPYDQIVVVHADLGRVEWSGAQEHINDTIDHPLNVVRAIDKNGKIRDLLDTVLERGRDLAARGKTTTPPWFSKSARYCTSTFKTGPCEKFIRHDLKKRGKLLAVNCMGIRAEESVDRSESSEMYLNVGLSKAKRTIYNWNPIFDFKIQEVFDIVAEYDQEVHPVYSLGMSRFSCAFCMLASKGDLKIAAESNPELFKEYEKVEEETGFTMFNGKKIREYVYGETFSV